MGLRPLNVVPPEAEVCYYLRANTLDADMHEVLPNRALAEALDRNLQHRWQAVACAGMPMGTCR